jgi:methionine-S-sulfoxide reductase
MRAAAVLFCALVACGTTEVPAPASTVAAARPPAGTETALLAGGCFWGMQEILRAVPGVVATDVGKVAGAETVRVVFDPRRLSYEELLYRWYFRMHDPTTLNQQGNDVGREYRSAIFVVSDEQRRVAEAVKARVAKEKRWPRPIVTEIVAAAPFERATEDHQDYLQKNPGGYSCHYLREWLT